MVNRYKKDAKAPNLMCYYFDDGGKVSGIIEQMRSGYIKGKTPKFEHSLIKAAQREITSVRSVLDKSTYPFAQDLNYHIFGDMKKRVILLVGGTFYGRENIESTLGFDLGSEPWKLFKGHNSNESIDSHITIEKTDEFLKNERDYLRSQNLDAFLIKASGFFYLNDPNTSKFEKNGEIDMYSLIPMLTHPKHVVTTPVNVPSSSEYKNSLDTPFVSYRLKKSLKGKLLKMLEKKNISDEDVIHDWAAHRIVVASEEEAKQLEGIMRDTITIGKKGKSKIKHIDTKDYYSNPKKNGYKGFNIVVEATTKGHPPCIREIQIVDKMQYYKNEVNPDDPAHHKQREKIKIPSRHNRDITAPNEITLEKIFGRRTLLPI